MKRKLERKKKLDPRYMSSEELIAYCDKTDHQEWSCFFWSSFLLPFGLVAGLCISEATNINPLIGIGCGLIPGLLSMGHGASAYFANKKAETYLKEYER